jgi:hypothetical protein
MPSKLWRRLCDSVHPIDSNLSPCCYSDCHNNFVRVFDADSFKGRYERLLEIALHIRLEPLEIDPNSTDFSETYNKAIKELIAKGIVNRGEVSSMTYIRIAVKVNNRRRGSWRSHLQVTNLKEGMMLTMTLTIGWNVNTQPSISSLVPRRRSPRIGTRCNKK